MIEIRIHGRGGQGNVVAAYLLAMAAFEEQRYGQAFPNFGAERRGAPVTAFVRIADRPIQRRNQVRHPTFLIIQDQALLQVPGVTDGLKPGGKILVNSSLESAELSKQLGQQAIALQATALAKKILGRPVPNTALLAAFFTLTEMLSQDSLAAVLQKRFKGDILEKNLQLIQEGAQQVPAGLWKEKEEESNAASA
ncbi:MAG: pyruvate oxidoreductase subunit gamma [Candidatus Parabeggiatoa sp. nov. 3]|nr:MAG: pyruvate oxidoreductase subunit gamma [Gammaproteobacteria bacterium]RKZ68302.1 MAG: pyruvate oxidoreductase subunit gamma [Gammaproteobacteria bacterium]RKZ79753.1 MAG: pyruvate oxidoreductase subunit gamma [Gammaproteobacteria bacterium]HEW97167.1 pyruvate oxidoreductase subunit gamma [Beggiatoa sp.]